MASLSILGGSALIRVSHTAQAHLTGAASLVQSPSSVHGQYVALGSPRTNFYNLIIHEALIMN